MVGTQIDNGSIGTVTFMFHVIPIGIPLIIWNSAINLSIQSFNGAAATISYKVLDQFINIPNAICSSKTIILKCMYTSRDAQLHFHVFFETFEHLHCINSKFCITLDGLRISKVDYRLQLYHPSISLQHELVKCIWEIISFTN